MSRSKETRNNQPPDKESKGVAKKFTEWLAKIKSAASKLNPATIVGDKIRKAIPHQSSDEKLNPKTDKVFEVFRNILGFIFNRLDLEIKGNTDFEKYNRPIIFVVAPHNGHMDSFLVRQAIKENRNKLLFVAAHDYWHDTKKLFFASLFFRLFLLHRKGSIALNDLKLLASLLINGERPVYFPEGTRNRNPKTPISERYFYKGITTLYLEALKEKPLIVPIYLENTENLMTVGSAIPAYREEIIDPETHKKTKKKRKVTAHILQHLDFNSLFSNIDNLTQVQIDNLSKTILHNIHQTFINAERELKNKKTKDPRDEDYI